MTKIIKLYCRCFGCNGTRKTATDMRTGRMVPQDRCAKCGGTGQVATVGPNTIPMSTRCPLCAEVNESGLVPLILPAGSACPLCEDGYAEAGITQGQVEKIHGERDGLLEFAARVADCVTRQGAEELTAAAERFVHGRRGEVDVIRQRLKAKRRANAPCADGQPDPPPDSIL